MASKADRFYYENFVSAADFACKAADYLVECLTSFDASKIGEMLEKMHVFEHEADKKKHEMSTALAKAFVTPLDREDLAELSQNIDEVVDAIEEVLRRVYVGQITTVMPEAVVFAKKIVSCCSMMKQMLVEFENFRKPEKLHKMIIDLNNAEEDCDKLYLEATIKVRSFGKDVLEVISWHEIFNYMEDCADACEHVADSVETVVMKNT